MGTSFRIDTARRRLWQGATEVALAPKPLAVLCAFVERPGEILAREDLEAKVWPDVRVTDAVLRYTIRQLRRTLGDDAAHPSFIATVPRRGWKLIAQVRVDADDGTRELTPCAPDLGPHPADATPIAGRDGELRRLGDALDCAHRGEARLVFLTGEAGIGKTTLLHEFLRRAADRRDTLVAAGECVPHYGSEEPYLPAIGALERLVAKVGETHAADILRRYAPAWLAQLPGLAAPEEQAQLAPTVLGTTAARMLRQFARAIEKFSTDHTVVLAFDDVHWGDAASLELISFLLHRPRPLRLLLLATIRPAEMANLPGVLVPIKRDLEIHGLSEEILLDGISRSAVEEYVAQRFRNDARADGQASGISAFVHRWTEGNPLFMVSVVDQLIARGVLREHDGALVLDSPPPALEAPSTIRRLIEEELDRVPPEHRAILETASVASMEFSAATVAAGAHTDVETVEQYCEALIESGRFLRAAGEDVWPDGTISSRYRFGHALYREILAEGLPAARRARLHREIGLERERAWGADAPRIAGELAHHFEQAGDGQRALGYFATAGDRAARRYANREAVAYLRKALRLLRAQPSSTERDDVELLLRLSASAPLAATQGYASADLADNLNRITALTRTTEATEASLPILLGLWSLHIVRGDLKEARKLGDRLVDIAATSEDRITHLQAQRVVGGTSFFAGEFPKARAHLEASLEGYDIAAHGPLDYSFGDDPVVLSLSYSALVLWFQGHADRALVEAEHSIAIGRALGHPPSLAFALSYAAILHQLRRDPARALPVVEELIALTEEEDVPLWFSLGRIVRGWAWSAEGRGDDGVAELRAGLHGWEATGADLARPHYVGLLAEALGVIGEVDEGLELLTTAGALIERTGQRAFEPERWRLEGELLQAAGRDGAVECYRRALRIARRLGAPALALRAAMSLSRCPLSTSERRRVYRALGEVRSSLNEGADTRDLLEADELLA